MKFRVAQQEETRAARFRALELCVPIRIGDEWIMSPHGEPVQVLSFERKVSLPNGSGFDQVDEKGEIPWPLVKFRYLGAGYAGPSAVVNWEGAPAFAFAVLVKIGGGQEWSPRLEKNRMNEHAERQAIKALRDVKEFLKKLTSLPTELKPDKSRVLSEVDHALGLLPVFPVQPAAAQLKKK